MHLDEYKTEKGAYHNPLLMRMMEESYKMRNGWYGWIGFGGSVT
jgi:hypothetical protein